MMRSKRSSPELALVRSDLRRSWPIAAITLIVQSFILPISLMYKLATRPIYAAAEDMPERLGEINMDEVIALTSLASLIIIPAAMLVIFDFMYSDRAAAAYFSYPVKRVRLFVTKALTAFSLVFVPNLLMFAAMLPMLTGTNVEMTVGKLAFGVLLMPAFFMACALFCMSFTAHPFSAALCYLVLNFVYVVTTLLLGFFGENFVYGVSDNYNSASVFNAFSPLIYAFEASVNQHVKPAAVVIIAVLTVIFAVLSVVVFRLRKTELTEEMFAFPAAALIAKFAASVYGGVIVSMILKEIFDIGELALFAILFAVMSFIFYIAADMVIKKKVRVFGVRNLVAWAALIAGVFALTAAGSAAAERYVPKAASVESAVLNGTYPIIIENEQELGDMRSIHLDLIKNKAVYTDKMTAGSSEDVTLTYKLRDGRVVRRSYSLPEKEPGSDAVNPAFGTLRALGDDPEKLFFAMFGCDRDQLQPAGGTVEIFDLRDEDNDITHIDLDVKKAAALVDMINGYITDPPRGMDVYTVAENLTWSHESQVQTDVELSYMIDPGVRHDFDWYFYDGYRIGYFWFYYADGPESDHNVSIFLGDMSTFDLRDRIAALEG